MTEPQELRLPGCQGRSCLDHGNDKCKILDCQILKKKLRSSWTQNWSTYTVCTLFFIFDDFDDSLSSTSSFWYQENQSKNLALLSGLLFKLWKHDLVLWSTSSCFALLTALTNQFLLTQISKHIIKFWWLKLCPFFILKLVHLRSKP